MTADPTAMPLPEVVEGSARRRSPLHGWSEAQLDEPTIIIVTALGHTVCHCGELVVVGALAALMLEFGIEWGMAASLPLMGYMLMGFGALPAGLWTDRWKPAPVLMVYFLAMTVASLAVAVSSNLIMLLGSLTLLGLALSIYHPAGLAMISLGVRARGRAMGINGVAGSLGVAAGPALGMMAVAWGSWRMAYVVVAAMSLVGGVVLAIAVRRSKTLATDSGLHPSPAAASDLPTETPSPEASKPPRTAIFTLVLLFGAMMLGGFNYRMLMTALPTYLTGETLAWSDGLKIFLVLIIGGFGQIFGGLAGDRIGARYVYLGMVALVVPAIFVLGTVGGTAWALPVAALVALCLFAQQPVENSLLAESTSVRRRSLSYGNKFALTFGIGALGAPVAGFLGDYYQLSYVFYLIAFSALLMATLLTLFLRRQRLT